MFHPKVVTETHARSNFAAQHLAAARYFQSVLRSIEDTQRPTKDQFAPPEYLHCWFGTVVFSVMALEANIYDVLTASDRGEQTPLGATPVPSEVHRQPILARYGFVWKTVLGQNFDLGQGVAQSTGVLIALRDEITHYKTEWRDRASVSRKLKSMLKSCIKLNPFKCGNIFFPEQCVSAESAAWAVTTAYDFMATFANRTGVRRNV